MGTPLIHNNILVGVTTVGFNVNENGKNYNTHIKVFSKLKFIYKVTLGQILWRDTECVDIDDNNVSTSR